MSDSTTKNDSINNTDTKQLNKSSDIQNKLLAADQYSNKHVTQDVTNEQITKPITRQLVQRNISVSSDNADIISPMNASIGTTSNGSSSADSSRTNSLDSTNSQRTIKQSAHTQSVQQWQNSPANQVRRGRSLWMNPSPLIRDRNTLHSLKALPIQPSPHYVTRDLVENNAVLFEDDITKPSPGPSIRRLAEQFLSSLPDDSPSMRARQINKNTDTVLNKLNHLQINDNQITVHALQSPTESLTPEQLQQQLHTDIVSFTQLCTIEQNKQQSVRQKLIQQTQHAIHTIWPAAIVDVVGSVQCNIALPRSDLDFVVTFPLSTEKPLCYTYVNNSKQICNDDIFYTKSDTQSDGKIQYFVHAGTLLKLIGGRKKSKLLFQSTKIQVFKDINLIRLRCGWTGTSIDIWFPSTVQTLQRSQLHCKLVDTALTKYSELYTLGCVVKSFMSQQNLNSGYSGLNTFGIELMLIHWLQHYYYNKTTDSAEIDYSELLYQFLLYYINFDYINKAIDVNNTDGNAAAKPDKSILNAQLKSAQPQSTEHHDNTSEDDIATESHHNDTNINELYTLAICDPYDTHNYIICHSKALTNIVISFIAAVHVIRPDTVSTVTLPTPLNHATNQEILQNYQLHKHTSNTHNMTLFQRIMDVTSVLDGPSMKLCQNRQCGILCPTQNKICFQCNYVFVTTNNRPVYTNRNQVRPPYNTQQRNTIPYHQQRMNSRHYYNAQHIQQPIQHIQSNNTVQQQGQAPLSYMQLNDGSVVPVMIYTQPNGEKLTLYGQPIRNNSPTMYQQPNSVYNAIPIQNTQIPYTHQPYY